MCKENKEKLRSRKMADGIHGIGYGNTSGVGGGYIPQRKGNDVEAEAQNQAQPQQNYEETQVDPNKVMDFLAQNNYFMPVQTEVNPAAEAGKVDAATEERIAGYMERFEQIYAIVEQEFGAELAPAVMDLVMDKLMGMA